MMALGKPDAAITFGDYADQFVWPCGVVVSALASHARDAGFDSRSG